MNLLLALTVVLSGTPGQAGRERFATPSNGANLGVWRITNDPTVRHHANYHNTQCWSPDGRWLCYTRWCEPSGKGRKSAAEVHVFDLAEDCGRQVDFGVNPRWAKQSSRLIYVHLQPDQGPSWEKGAELKQFQPESGPPRHVAYGVESLGETDVQDRWIYGAKRYRGQQPEFRLVRVDLRTSDRVEPLPEATGSQFLPNPRHPVFFTRHDHRSEPFGATRYGYDLDGRNQRILVPTLQQCHMAWLGSGEYLLLGNGQVRGRRWDEPFPSNVHLLAAVSVGDVSPCGRSGRYACGDHMVADLRSGDGWHYIDPLSIVCYPARIADNSDIYDADPKGSPDGTKIALVSNYDLRSGPLAHLVDDSAAGTDVLRVDSTAGFPDSGALVVRREVIGYRRKTLTTFEGLSRRLHDTVEAGLRAGVPVTSFEARCLTDAQWRSLGSPTRAMRSSVDDPRSPLLRQRQTDVYVVVVRRPDRPWLRLTGSHVELIPGEEHYETGGYHLLRGGQRITAVPLRPGAAETRLEPGQYEAVAVEWSGLESQPSTLLRLERPAALRVLPDPPADFSWTTERWLADRRAISAEEAARSTEAVCEVVHCYDGIIQRRWYQRGVRVRQHDLNGQGQAIRRLAYHQGKLQTRDYYDRQERQVSRERFDTAGFIVESIRYRHLDDRAMEYEHWWFDRGMPVRCLSRQREEYLKQGDKWVAVGQKPVDNAKIAP